MANRVQREDVDNDGKPDGMRETCCMQCWTRKYHSVLILYEVSCKDVYVSTLIIQNLIVADEAANPEATVEGDTLSGLLFADEFVGISERPEGCQRETEMTLNTLGNGGWLTR